MNKKVQEEKIKVPVVGTIIYNNLVKPVPHGTLGGDEKKKYAITVDFPLSDELVKWLMAVLVVPSAGEFRLQPTQYMKKAQSLGFVFVNSDGDKVENSKSEGCVAVRMSFKCPQWHDPTDFKNVFVHDPTVVKKVRPLSVDKVTSMGYGSTVRVTFSVFNYTKSGRIGARVNLHQLLVMTYNESHPEEDCIFSEDEVADGEVMESSVLDDDIPDDFGDTLAETEQTWEKPKKEKETKEEGIEVVL